MDKISKTIPSLPSSLRPPRYVVITAAAAAAVALITIAPVGYLKAKHSRLKKRVETTKSYRVADLAEVVSHLNLKTVPLDEPNEPSGECRVFHDSCSRSVPKDLLPDFTPREMLNRYMRRNMVEFTKLPAARIMRYTFRPYPEIVRSFDASVVAKLDFEEGDWACGYQVFHRTDGDMELGVTMQPQSKDARTGKWTGPGEFKGRLCVSVREKTQRRTVNGMEDGEEELEVLEFETTTVMYTRKDEKSWMPMERAVPRFLHELGAWTMLVEGTDYLMGLQRDTKETRDKSAELKT